MLWKFPEVPVEVPLDVLEAVHPKIPLGISQEASLEVLPTVSRISPGRVTYRFSGSSIRWSSERSS